MRRKTKQILSVFVAVLVIVGAIAGVVALTTRKTKSLSSAMFAIGGIDDDGIFAESKVSIYTKEMFECAGLVIEPDYEASGTYRVFYYTDAGVLLGSTGEMVTTDGKYERGNAFPLAQYARIMYTPAVPKDDEGYEDEDFEIRFWQVLGFAKELDVIVSTDQRFSCKKILAHAEDLTLGNWTRPGKTTEEPRRIGLCEPGVDLWKNLNPSTTTATDLYGVNDIRVDGCSTVVLKIKKSAYGAPLHWMSVTYTCPYFDGNGSAQFNNPGTIIQEEGEFVYVLYRIKGISSFSVAVTQDAYSTFAVYAFE